MLALTISGGAWIFLAAVVALFFIVAYALYTTEASGINKHPYTNHDPMTAPGAALPDEGPDFETFENQILGLRPHHHG